MKAPAQQQILYFVDGPVPTDADLAAAKALGDVSFRNARKRGLPPKDGCKVAGCVPENYLKGKGVTVIKVSKSQAELNAEAEANKNKNK